MNRRQLLMMRIRGLSGPFFKHHHGVPRLSTSAGNFIVGASPLPEGNPFIMVVGLDVGNNTYGYGSLFGSLQPQAWTGDTSQAVIFTLSHDADIAGADYLKLRFAGNAQPNSAPILWHMNGETAVLSWVVDHYEGTNLNMAAYLIANVNRGIRLGLEAT
jgi:hypothetical protein